MNKQLIEYAKRLTSNKNPLSVYKNLEEIMYNAGLYQELLGILKSIWHITNDDDILLKMCNLQVNVYNNYSAAYKVSSLYFQRRNPQFYQIFMSILNNKGYNELKPNFETLNYSAPIFKIMDKYNAVISIMIYLEQQKDFDTILELIPYLNLLREQVINFTLNLKEDEKFILQEVETFNIHLSELLSKKEHFNDINEFAIKLNPYNEQAYLNIIDDYISDGKKELALNFYNSNYIKVFKKNEISTLIQLYWSISDVYSSKGYKFKAVQYQKYAIDSELNKG